MSNNFSLERVEVSSSPAERFEEYLQSRGKRITQQRKAIVNQVFSHHEHFDADALLAELQAALGGRKKIGRATVYRTLRELVDAGLLREMTLNGRTVYEHDYGYPQHDHLYCKECERLIEFQSDELIALRDAVARQNKFRVTGHRFIVTGICSKCMKSRQRPTRRLEMV
jgi:Fur family ferric uptake transcriptional regulator